MKSKRTTYLPDPVFSVEDTAILMLSTTLLSYEIAKFLNDAYRLQLARISDIDIDGALHPCFFYYSDAQWLSYIVIQRPADGVCDPVFDSYDKIILIRGRDAWEVQKTIYGDIHSRHLWAVAEPDPTDILDHRRWELLNTLAKGVSAIDTYCFSRRRGISTTLRLRQSAPTLFPIEPDEADSAERRAISLRCSQLQKYLNTLFDILQYHLTEEEEYL